VPQRIDRDAAYIQFDNLAEAAASQSVAAPAYVRTCEPARHRQAFHAECTGLASIRAMEQALEEQFSELTTNIPKVINPTAHAVLDYATAGSFLAMAFSWMHSHPRAASLAFINGVSVLMLSLMTDYPGGVWRRISFPMHGKMDAVQAGMSAFGPALMGFAGDPEAKMFYAQAATETGVIAATDWNAATV
jgi:hypothetical protein